jgi:hypothetical protein
MSTRRSLSALIVAALRALMVVMVGGGSAGASSQQLVAAFGKANLGGETVYVHTVSVVQRGERPADVAAASLAAQGARPISSAEFQATGLKLQDSNTTTEAIDALFHYIGSTPVPQGFDSDLVREQFVAALTDPNPASNGSPQSWAEAAKAVTKLSVAPLGSTDAVDCPSLVRECSGGQYSDGSNDVGWVDIKGRSTLGVTWYTSTEADIALDLNQNWCIDKDTAHACSSRDFDIRTVILHEFGHALGLGHEESGDTVMNAYYGDVDWTVGLDDIAGLQFIYDGAAAGGGGNGGGETPTGTMTATYDITRSGRGGRDLIVTVTVKAGGVPVSGASEWIELDWKNDGTIDATGGPATTDDNGQVRWRVRNAPGGDDWNPHAYVVADGLGCDDTCTASAPS